jgi:hypothetical protein
LSSGNAAARQHKNFAGKHNAYRCQNDEKVWQSLRMAPGFPRGNELEPEPFALSRAIVFPYTHILIRYFRIVGPCG